MATIDPDVRLTQWPGGAEIVPGPRRRTRPPRTLGAASDSARQGADRDQLALC